VGRLRKMKLGKAIKELRKQKGISQKDFALKVSISPTSLSLIESDVKRPSNTTLKKICKELKISEPLIYIAATEEEDVPKQKRELFRLLFPSVKSLVMQIAGED
jgi:XRE family transcriptional regulator, regulator of sulfur utilization